MKLDTIDSPINIKALSVPQLKELAQEIRQTIIDVMAVSGGHLASNLGVVELTIALHYVFSSPTDRFIFDVSHQTYTHKLLTGRLQHFRKIRQFKGLAGFACPTESEHDHFYAGHAGTALSLGLGLAKNRSLTQRNEHVIPILGDASLTCGLTLEALNNISRDLNRFIVILNDNKMSISNNVGAITHILSRFLSNPTSNKIYEELEKIVSKIPGLGKGLAKHGHRVRESIKNLVSTAPFFEQYGLAYVGPIDGHNLEQMIDVFTNLKDSQHPILVHTMTVKGKGMDSATENPIVWHGCKPFDKITGQFQNAAGKLTFPQVFGKQILKMAEKDPSLIAVTPAMPTGSCLDNFMHMFPDRCLDVGIAEGHAVTFCGGLAYGKKMKVLAVIYATFLQRALDNLFHDVCLQQLPVVFAIDRAGLSPADGPTHHGIYDIAFLNAMPNMVICQPRDGVLLRELMESAFSWGRPTAIRYPNHPTTDSDNVLQMRELGVGEILHEGSGELLIIALGHMCSIALQVKDLLAELGVQATVVDPIFVKPLDSDLFCRLLLSHRQVVTIEEHSLNGGLGLIFNTFMMRSGFYHIPVLNIGIPDTFVEQGSHKELLQEIGLDSMSIYHQIVRYFDLQRSPIGVL